MIDKPPQVNSSEQSKPGIQAVLRPINLIQGLRPEYVLSRFPATIGRHPTNDVELPFESISRYHARMELEEGALRLVDLNSSNGTYVNGKRVMISQVSDQDAVAFGSLGFTLVTNEPPEEAFEGKDQTDTSSVHFVVDDERIETIYHTEVPEDVTRVAQVAEEITDETSLQRAKSHLKCFYRLHELLNSTTDEGRLLRRTLDLVFEVLPVNRGVVLMRDRFEPSLFRPVVIKTGTPNSRERIGISKTILQRCLKERVAILTRNAQEDKRFEGAESIMLNKLRSVMVVPLISANHVFGFIHLDTTEAVRSFSEEDLAFLANMGTEIAIHLHNLRMLQERILSERMAAIGQTITGMAHNIKNILVLSQGGIEMMNKRLEEKNYDRLEETWGLVRRGLDRINKLVQDMLDYSRARVVEKRRVDPNALLTDLSETFSEEMRKRGIQCRLDLDETCPPVMLDVDGIEKAICNLILNAMEACPEATGEITLRTRKDGEGNLDIEVEDNAGGIPREIQPRIFVPFFTTKGSKGSGLGLAMTKKVIEDMGARIAVKSIEGKGTCFTITIFIEPGDLKLTRQADVE